MDGFNNSILFMLAVVLLIPTVFGFLVWNSYRTARRRALEFAENAELT
ncbi:MAG: hypothetical protein AAF682_28100 [Planctomycetota bacterium]